MLVGTMLRSYIVGGLDVGRFCILYFSNEDMIVENTCYRAWSESIHTRMAHGNQIMKYVEYRSAKNQVALEAEYVSIWCAGEVLCKGDFSSLQLNLSPPFSPNQEILFPINGIGWLPFYGFMNSLCFFPNLKRKRQSATHWLKEIHY